MVITGPNAVTVVDFCVVDLGLFGRVGVRLVVVRLVGRLVVVRFVGRLVVVRLFGRFVVFLLPPGFLQFFPFLQFGFFFFLGKTVALVCTL